MGGWWQVRQLSGVQPAPVELVLYTKADCCLCEEAKALLAAVGACMAFRLREVDISEDPALLARFGEEIPVLFVNGRKAFKGRIDEGRLRRIIEEAGEGESFWGRRDPHRWRDLPP